MQRKTKARTALLCLVLAAGTLAGCAPARQTGAPADSAPAQTGEEAANPLDDGRLRYLYPVNGSGGGTLLRGDTVVYRAAPSESISLLYAPGADAPAGWQLGRNEADGARVTEVYGADGALLWTEPGDWRASLAEGLLALEPGGFAVDAGPGGPGGCRLIELDSGEEIPLPAETSACVPVGGGQVVLTLTADPGAPGTSGSDVVVIDLAGGERSRVEDAYAYRAYDEAGPSLYAAAQTHDMETDVWSNSLYDFASGEWIEGFDGFCAHNTICYRVEDGYAVRRLGEAEPLAVYDGRCPYWRADAAVVSRDSGSVLVTEEGELPLLGGFGAYASNGEEAAFLLDDGRLLFYGPDGRSEVETDLGALSGQADSWVSVYSVQDGCVLLSVTDAAHPDGHSLIYDASGLVYDSAGSGYENMNYLTMGPDGPVYSASRRGVGGGWISDVVDSRGQVLLSGLADVSRGDGLPDGVIAARRGFERGYMDLDGSWLYSESIFASLADEDSAYYW